MIFGQSALLNALWYSYSFFALIYAVCYIVWAARVGKMYTKIQEGTPRVAMRATKSAILHYRFLLTFYIGTVTLMFGSIMYNIFAIDNSGLTYVAIAIAAPWVVMLLSRFAIERVSNKLEVRPKNLMPRPLSITAQVRLEGYKNGAFKTK